MNVILETENLSIGYKGVQIAENLNLNLREGEVTALIGRNGAGKSTLIKTLTGNLPPLKGSVTINKENITKINRKDLSRLISVVNTDPHMAGGLRLRELVELGRIPYTGRIGILSKDDNRIVEEALKATGVLHMKERYVSELSDGERQKGMIARGLAQETPLIIMDEPFSFLDVASRWEILELMKNLAIEKNKAILFSTHEVSEALRMSDRIWLFTVNGLLEGEPEKLISSGAVDLLFPQSRIKFDKKKGDFYLPDK